ncbi:MAG TPA: isoprenylcysteine carboxylmethyltransferase family protein [Pseudolabrys sp.]|nr:isoprenylcysteine carboxylmethyltransferase family protein [Pseudolabrys sp.]
MGTAMATGPSQGARKTIIALTIALAVGFLFVAGSYWQDGGLVHEGVEWIGVVLIVTCILGRTWCTFYIGGRKNAVLVADGPYSICRNPLYTFSIIGAAGVGAQFGSVTVALVCSLFAWMVFQWTALREEAALQQAFHEDFRRYMVRVPRFLPNPKLWHSPPTLIVQPRMIMTTFVDALIFLTAIPLMETFEYLHDSGILPVFFKVP